MASLFQQIKAGTLWDFHGGIHPPARKTQTSQKPIAHLPMPERLYLPLRQHIGVAGALLVQPGDYVLKGQALTAANNAMAVPVHAPTSGYILSIVEHPSAHPSALPEPMMVLEPDGLDQWRERFPLDPEHASRQQILARIQDAGIAGMGGAGFPTHIKSSASQGVDYLIINAAECEPYITADDTLMQSAAETIIQGIDILADLLSPKAVLIGIEDDKPRAIAAMQAVCEHRKDYYVRVVPAKYPSGGEKQLIQRLTSKEVPAGRRPLDIGIVMQNVGTAFAIAQAVHHDIPLISRVVTVVGETLSRPQNVIALLGTPVGFLLEHCGFTPEPEQRVIMGGPMMGFTLPGLQIPVVKTTNCIIAPTQAELPPSGPEMDCIRCGACAEACPVTLLPQQLLWFSKAKDQEKLKEHNLADCIECGACAYVCPSEIPLVHYYRVAKAEIREQHRDELKAEQAKARFEARNERLEREKQQRMAKNQALAAQRQSMLAEQQKQQIAAAAERVEATTPLSKEEIIAERERKKTEARAYQAAKAASSQPATAEPQTSIEPSAAEAQTAATDPRAAAVAAAIARAKAKKAGSDVSSSSESSNSADNFSADNSSTADLASSPAAEQNTDPRAAAVAAAIARAKAKKAANDTAPAQTAESASAVTADTDHQTPAVETTAVDPRAAAVAAAIARAKAKKAAAETASSETSLAATKQTASESPIESATEAAIETARAPTETSLPNETPNETPTDPRAAAVAAAIARAKAKKAQAAIVDATQVENSNLTANNSLDNEAEPATKDVSTIELTGNTVNSAEASAKNEPSQQATEPKLADAFTATTSAADAKKAAIAAAIARAKAKKANPAPSSNDEEQSS